MKPTQTPVSYSHYLQLERILNSQSLKSEEYGEPAHDEMLFIIIHQTYELWFKQVIYELDSVLVMFQKDFVDERNIGVALARVKRIIEIQKILIDQVRILETMTPLDFLDFRNFLTPASGFQSFQFRALEIKLGLRPEERIKYSQKAYHKLFPEDQQQKLLEMEQQPSLFDLLNNWLERTPFLELEKFNFLETYAQAVAQMLAQDQKVIRENPLINKAEQESRIKMMSATEKHFQSLLDKSAYQQLVREGRRRFSHKAFLAALFIHLYRDQPILHQPYQLLRAIVDVDELFSAWRYRHALMVLRMIGQKTGTGGSAGYGYLKATSETHRVFGDLFNIATFLVPRSLLPNLPGQVEQQLGFYFSHSQS